MTNRNFALKIALAYLAFGVTWILFSDIIVSALAPTIAVLTFISIIKGFLFVILSAILIYTLSNRYMRKLSQSSLDLKESYDELLTTHLDLEKKEATIRAIFDATNDAIFVHDAVSAELINCNRKCEELLGLPLREIQKMSITTFDSLYFNNELVKTVRSAPTGAAEIVTVSMTNRQGDRLYLEANHRKVTIGNTLCTIAVVRDISDRIKAETELAYAQTQKLALLKAIPDLILLFNKQGVFLDYNQPIDFNLFISPEEFIGKQLNDIFPSEFAQQALYCIQQTITTGDIQLFEYQLLQNDQMRDFESRFVKSSSDEALAIIRDVTYKKQMEQQLEYISLHDPLTDIYNRTYFEKKLLQIKDFKNKSVGVIVCDVDGLKLINDTLGHHAGDELLKVVATILSSCAPFPDVVARIGGDEFSVLVFSPEQSNMLQLDTSIKASVEKYNQSSPQLPLSLSIGWAADFNTSETIDSLLKEADNSMYREKMHRGLSTRSSIVQAMMKALEARDYITEGHADRLQAIAEKLALKLQLPSRTLSDLRLLAKFHDIGKVGIPDNILFKPDRLTPAEAVIMRRHPEIGFRIAKSAPDLEPIAEWILKHHEWWDGTGYPLGLAGEDIPLECRIISISDAFDAMTSDRPYRKAMTLQATINEIRSCSGTQFDPALTELFIESL